IKVVIPILIELLSVETSLAQNHEEIDSLTQQLQEIVVTAKQPVTRLVGSTLVSTIKGTSLVNLGNALDVLAQLPMIKVQDNTVYVIGKDNIEIYIDGRPMRDNIELQHMLSSDIKRVELLMAPGPVYASTTGAVLKITTHRNFMQGVSLTDQAKIQCRRKWSVMDYLGFGYRYDNLEFFVNGTVNYTNSISKGCTTNKLMYCGSETVVGSSQINSYPTTVGVVKAGFNYAKGTLSTGAYYRYNPECGDFNNSGTEWLDRNPIILRDIDKRRGSHNHLTALYFENNFAGKYLLHFDGDLQQSYGRNSVATTYPGLVGSDVYSTDERRSTLFAGKLSLKFPLLSGDFIVGTQDSYTHTSLDYRMLNPQVAEYIPSSFTDARQTSASLYVSWSRIYEKFSVSVGARYEYVDYDFNIDGKRDEDVSRQDHLLTPDLSFGYSFSNESRISLNYKMATVKPPYSQLTGSLSYVGMHEIEGGNPALRDEKMHNIQLSGMWRDFMLQMDYVRGINTYAYVKQLYDDGNLLLIMHPVNINVSALNMYLIWSRSVRHWTPDVTVGMYRQWLKLDKFSYNKPIFSYYFNNSFSLPRGWIITANISGRTSGDMHTNCFGTTWFTMDASVGKIFFKSLTVKLAVTDIFNTVNNNWTMNTYGIYVDKRWSHDHRGVSLNLIYNFQPLKSQYKGVSAAEAEMKRL
ncbi:MAG: outer membrane beta-barrel family protein, partial [Muribaculum sp.]|nr:outer membrane beta-barrel family protein [Muribaculum sp.]